MSEQTNDQQGAAPATAAEAAKFIHDKWASVTTDGLATIVAEYANAVAERVAAARVAEATKQALAIAESMDRMGLASLEGPEWVKTPRTTWNRWCNALAALPAATDVQDRR